MRWSIVAVLGLVLAISSRKAAEGQETPPKADAPPPAAAKKAESASEPEKAAAPTPEPKAVDTPERTDASSAGTKADLRGTARQESESGWPAFLESQWFVAVLAAVLSWLVTWWFTRTSSRKEATLKLHESHMISQEFLYHRMNVQKMLFLDNSGEGESVDQRFVKYSKARTLPQLRSMMDVDDWVSVTYMMNFFRVLNTWKKNGIVDAALARKMFGWMYTWWYYHLIEPFGKEIDTTIGNERTRDILASEWGETREKLSWLILDGEDESSKGRISRRLAEWLLRDHNRDKDAAEKIKKLAEFRMEVRKHYPDSPPEYREAAESARPHQQEGERDAGVSENACE